MTVLYIVDPGIVGGATISFMEVIHQVTTNGIKSIVCTSEENELSRRLESVGIKTCILGHRQMLDPVSPHKWKRPIKYPIKWIEYRIKRYIALSKIESMVDFSEVDLIHTNSARVDLGCYLSRKYGIPHIMHFREFADLDFKCITYNSNYIDLYNQYVTKFVAISDAVKKHWVSKGLRLEKFTTIYNGISYEDIVKSNNEAKYAPSLKMVMTGGVCEAKGQYIAIKAFQMLPDEIKEKMSLDIIGWDDPEYLKLCKEFISKHDLTEKIHFLGASNKVHNILGMYQIGLMCSKAEGFGRVTAEYMHARLGVIASNSGANPELIADKENGLLFDSGNPASLAECIEKYFNNRELLVNCSICAEETATGKFTAEKNAKSIIDLYQTVSNTNKK